MVVIGASYLISKGRENVIAQMEVLTHLPSEMNILMIVTNKEGQIKLCKECYSILQSINICVIHCLEMSTNSTLSWKVSRFTAAYLCSTVQFRFAAGKQFA